MAVTGHICRSSLHPRTRQGVDGLVRVGESGAKAAQCVTEQRLQAHPGQSKGNGHTLRSFSPLAMHVRVTHMEGDGEACKQVDLAIPEMMRLLKKGDPTSMAKAMVLKANPTRALLLPFKELCYHVSYFTTEVAH